MYIRMYQRHYNCNWPYHHDGSPAQYSSCHACAPTSTCTHDISATTPATNPTTMSAGCSPLRFCFLQCLHTSIASFLQICFNCACGRYFFPETLAARTSGFSMLSESNFKQVSGEGLPLRLEPNCGRSQLYLISQGCTGCPRAPASFFSSRNTWNHAGRCSLRETQDNPTFRCGYAVRV